MAKPIIHLSSVAGPCAALLDRLELRSCEGIIALAQQAVGSSYRVTGRPALMNPQFDERRGGRRDDAQRCRDINRVFSDDRVAAMVALRGGAWLTRLLPHLDFEALKQRRTVLHIFGFSELTTLINIAARYPKVRAYYDHDLGHLRAVEGDYRRAFRNCLQELVGIVEGRGSSRLLCGRLTRGSISGTRRIRAVGGCLSVLVALAGSPFKKCLIPRGKWLALEDIHDDPYGIDRNLAHLKLAGVFEQCQGLLLGDFHIEDAEEGEQDQTPAVLELLQFHLPPRRRVPVIAHCNFGHCHPAAPLPINRPLLLTPRAGARRRIIHIRAADDC